MNPGAHAGEGSRGPSISPARERCQSAGGGADKIPNRTRNARRSSVGATGASPQDHPAAAYDPDAMGS